LQIINGEMEHSASTKNKAGGISKDINMTFGLEKCANIFLKKGRI
jgi:hypothetical protein